MWEQQVILRLGRTALCQPCPLLYPLALCPALLFFNEVSPLQGNALTGILKHTHSHTHSRSTYAHAHTRTYTHVHAHSHTHTHTHTCTHICGHTGVQTQSQTHTNAHACMRAHTQTHTHTRIFIPYPNTHTVIVWINCRYLRI